MISLAPQHVHEDGTESAAEPTLVTPRLPIEGDRHAPLTSRPLTSRHPTGAHQCAIRDIAAILLGDSHDLSDLPSTFNALGDLGYSITAPEWEGLYFKTISGVPEAARVREAVSRDLWQNMYGEPDLKQRSDIVRILLQLPFDAVFNDGPGIESSRELSVATRKVAVLEYTPPKAKHAPRSPDIPLVDQTSLQEPPPRLEPTPISTRRGGMMESCREEQFPLEALLYLKQLEVRKLAELLAPGILSSSDPGKLFTVLEEKVPGTTSSLWRRIYLEGAGFGAVEAELRAAIERGIVTALCSRVANVGEVLQQELSKIDWNVLYADCRPAGDERKELSGSDIVEDVRRRLDDPFMQTRHSPDDTFVTDSVTGVKIIAAARAALTGRLREVKEQAMRRLTREFGKEYGASTSEELEQVSDFFASERQHKNVFGAIESTGHDEDFVPYVDNKFLPTDAPAGSKEKQNELALRAELGYELWHPDDRVDYRGISWVENLIAPASETETGVETEPSVVSKE